MQKELVSRPEIKLVGLSVRTNNKDEMNPKTAKIASVWRDFYELNVAEKIPDRTNKGVLISVYTEYMTDENGPYTYFLGEEVNSFEDAPIELDRMVIEDATYQRFTTSTGPMPKIVIDAWMRIWNMSPADFGGTRAYVADFEVYDERASDPANAVVDIYIGVNV